MIYNHEVVRSLSPSITIPFQRGVSYLADVASSLACLARLAPKPAGSVLPSLCPSDLRSVPAVAGLVAADLVAVLVVVAVAVAAPADPVSGLACLGSVVAAVVAVVAATSPSP